MIQEEEYWEEVEDPPNINRYALILHPTETFLKWVHSTPDQENPPLTLASLQDEPVVYLIPEVEEWEDWLRDHYLDLFEQELHGWYTDPTAWPPDRSFKVFKEFFTITFHSLVADVAEEPLG